MASTASLSRTFWISIPKAVRDAQAWRAGQLFALIPKGGSVLVVPVPDREALTGIAAGADPRDYRERVW